MKEWVEREEIQDFFFVSFLSLSKQHLIIIQFTNNGFAKNEEVDKLLTLLT
jgi:hypothetical protein